MAKAPAKKVSGPGRFRRFFSWFGRHKITAVFSVLVLALALFLAGSWVVLQVQIHFERERFESADRLIDSLQSDFTWSGKLSIRKLDNCTHSNFGGIFEEDTISCDTGIDENYLNVTKQETQNITQKIKVQLAARNSVRLTKSYTNDPANIESYRFIYNHIKCDLAAAYYYPGTASPYKSPIIPSNINAANINIDCGGQTKRDYFPVVNG